MALPGLSAASASSTLLRRTAGRGIPRTATAHVLRPAAIGARRALTKRYAFSLVGRSAASSGFKQFIQRATRLQFRLRKNLSLRAVVGDVATNKPDGDGHSPVHITNVRPLLFTFTAIAAETAGEALGGFVGGYLLGALTGGTKRLHKEIRQLSSGTTPTTPAMPVVATTSSTLLPYPSLTQFSQQSLRFHAHNMAWAKEWGKISAVFGACRMLVKTVRHNQEDGWNSVAGSAVAGALLTVSPSRTNWNLKLVSSCSKGALLYGGTMFLLHPDLWKPSMEAMWLTPPPAPQPMVMDQEDQEQGELILITEPRHEAPWYDRIGMME